MFFSSNLPGWQKYDSSPPPVASACAAHRGGRAESKALSLSSPCALNWTPWAARYGILARCCTRPASVSPSPSRHPATFPRLSELQTWTEDGIQCSQGEVDKKCQEETCTFKGQATGKGFVGRFLHGSGSSLSGLAVSSCASNSKTPEEENQVIPSIQRLTPPPPPPPPGEQSPPLLRGFV